MKKRIVLALCLLLAGTASAQKVRFEWGVLAGLNLSDHTTPEKGYSVKNKVGWQAGIITGVNFGIIAVEPQVIFVRQGLKFQPEAGGELNLRSNSIDVPVTASLRLLKPFRIYAGPVFTVMNDCKRKDGRDLIDFGRVRPTLSYTAGVSLALGHKLIDLRYNGQFSGKEEVILPDGSQLGKLRSWNIALSFGYIF